MQRFVLTWLVFGGLSTSGFYLPGIAPVEYDDGETVILKVNSLSSVRTQLPYNYYSLPFCEPGKVVNEKENVGEILGGDKIQNSPYEIEMNVEKTCEVLCVDDFDDDKLGQFRSKIEEEYHINWIMDNLPAVWIDAHMHNGKFRLDHDGGFPIGHFNPDTKEYALHNHVRLLLKYHTEPDSFEGKRVVGFDVMPLSINHDINDDGDVVSCKMDSVVDMPSDNELSLSLEDDETSKRIVFSYDVQWEYSPVRWASRWDAYLNRVDNKVHWFSIINSMVIVFFLTGLVAMIMNRTLNRDIDRYNRVDMTEEDTLDESGWKSVHGDVFRPPPHPQFLSVCVGTGAQVLSMVVVTMVFALFGFLSPANRGGLMTAMLLLFTSMGFFAGYTSSRLYKSIKGVEWWQTAVLTATFFPGLAFAVFFVLNMVIWGEKSSGFVNFWTLLSLLGMWFGISLPLVMAGAWLGYLKPAIEEPVTINELPREQLVPLPWYSSAWFTCMLGGVLPFGVVFIEVFFILSSMWLDQYYYASTTASECATLGHRVP